jgi:hypothetical protein
MTPTTKISKVPTLILITTTQRIEYWSEYQHHVIVMGLKLNTKYNKRCIVEFDGGGQANIENCPSTMNDMDDTDDDYYNTKSDIHQDADEFEDYYRKQRRRMQY